MGTDIHGIFQRKTETGWEDIESKYEENRHYLLFSWLGNVRNGYGFAGVKTYDPIKPLSDNRGFPDDFEIVDIEEYGIYHPITKNEMRGKMAKWFKDEDNDPTEPTCLKLWMGDHSFSWVSSKEVLDSDLPNTIRTGIVTIDQYKEWDGKSGPEDWSGDVWGANVRIANTIDEITDETTHVRISWNENIFEQVSYFVDEVQRLVDLHGEVRYVFGFDS